MASKIQDPIVVTNVEKPSLKYSMTPKIASEPDDKTAFSLIPDRVLLVEDVRFFTKCRVEELGNVEIKNAYDELCTDGKMDNKYEHIKIKGLTKALTYPRVFKPQWVKGLKLNNVTDPELKFAIIVIGYCFFQSAKENNVPCAAVDLAYKIVKKGMKVDLCEVLLKNLFENLNTIRKPKKNNSANTLKFRSLLVCMFFYFEKFFPTVGKVFWELHRPITHQINDFIKKLGDNFNDIMDDYFSKFQEKMHNKYRIPPQLVEKYKDEICFEVDTDYCYVNAMELRTQSLSPMGYEIDFDITQQQIDAYLSLPRHTTELRYGTYEERKEKVKMSIVVPKATRKATKMIKALTKKFGEESSSTPIKGVLAITEDETEAQEAAITLSTELPKGKVLKRKKQDTSMALLTPPTKRPNTRASAASPSKKQKTVAIPK
ncbi:hypothetical protein SUGI_0745720 [Cryptomeria japonica]|nr:hypothetical protein SUGI_0745720 [Cryptomeria japonica]